MTAVNHGRSLSSQPFTTATLEALNPEEQPLPPTTPQQEGNHQ